MCDASQLSNGTYLSTELSQFLCFIVGLNGDVNMTRIVKCDDFNTQRDEVNSVKQHGRS